MRFRRSRGGFPVAAQNYWWALLALAAILLFNLFFTPNFFRFTVRDGHLFGSLVDILNRAAPIMLMAMGMTLAIATKGIDISVGSVAAISGAIAAVLITKAHASLPLILAVSLGAGVVLGAWNGLLITVVGIQPIITTLIMMVMGRGIAQLITDGQIVVFEDRAFQFIGNNGFVLGLPFTVTIVVVMLGLSGLVLRRTALGLFIESTGVNPSASRYAGVNVKFITFLIYVFTAFCASIAGLIYASNIKAADCNTAGLNAEMDVILAVVLGGTSMVDGGKFSLIGSMIGALVIQSLTTTILTLGVPVNVTLIVRAGVVFVLCMLQSEDFRRMVSGALSRLAAREVAR